MVHINQLELPRSLPALAWQLKEVFSPHLSSHNSLLSGKFLLPLHYWTEDFLFALTLVTHISIMFDDRKPHKNILMYSHIYMVI